MNNNNVITDICYIFIYFRFKSHISTSWLVRKLTSPRLDWPRVDLSVNCPVTIRTTKTSVEIALLQLNKYVPDLWTVSAIRLSTALIFKFLLLTINGYTLQRAWVTEPVLICFWRVVQLQNLKVFTCSAPYPVDVFVRLSLRERGWVEKFSPRMLTAAIPTDTTDRALQCSTDEGHYVVCIQGDPNKWPKLSKYCIT